MSLPAPERRSLPGPDDIVRVELPNGIVILARRNDNSPSVNLNGFVWGGAIDDPLDKLGLAGLTAAALMHGTRRRSHQQLYDDLESAGATFGYSGGMLTTGLGGKALAEDLPLLLEMLNETLRQPVFPADEVERLRTQWITDLQISYQDTAEMAGLRFDALLYGEHPYARPEDGTLSSIQAIQLSDLIDYHARRYGPRGLTLSIAGAVDPQRAIDLAASILGDWHNPRQPAAPHIPAAMAPREPIHAQVSMPGKSQADLITGTLGPARTDPDYLPLLLGNHVLGQFGMYGRIGQVVREEHGLAYYAYSGLNSGIGPGSWYAAAGVSPADAPRALELMQAELGKFLAEAVQPEELADTQANFVGRLPLSLETNAGVASALLHLERYQLGLDYYWRYADLIEAVTPEQVLETARRWMNPDALVTVIAGP